MATNQFDFCLSGGTVVDVRGGEGRRAAIAVTGDRIGAIGDDDALAARSARAINVRGGVIVPGYIEPHTHSILANPAEMAYAIAAHGTTTAVVDGLPLMMTVAPERLAVTLELLSSLPVTIRWLIRLHPQSFTDDGGFTLPALRALWRRPFAAAVGEVTRWPDVLAGDADLLAKIAAAREDDVRVEGHAPGASLERLRGLAAAGFTSDHEAINAADVRNRLDAGLYVMLRDSSIRPDLPDLLKGIPDGAITAGRVMLTVDGPSPFFLADVGGYQDRLVRIAIESGIDPIDALRMVTVNPADYFGFSDRGEIAAGNRADLNVIRSLEDPRPTVVIAGGRIVAEDGRSVSPPLLDLVSLISRPELMPHSADFFRPGADAPPTLRFVNDVILDLAESSDSPLRALLVDREGFWVTRARLAGLAQRLGGLATTISSAFDPLIIGTNPTDMAAAYCLLADQGGGIAVVEDGKAVFSLPLELGGIFSTRPWAEMVDASRRFLALMRERGYRFADPLFSLLFLTFDSLPYVRLTSRGIWDARQRKVLYPSQPI